MVGSFPLQGEESQCWRMARFPLTIAPCSSAVQQCRLAGISQASGCSRLGTAIPSTTASVGGCRNRPFDFALGLWLLFPGSRHRACSFSPTRRRRQRAWLRQLTMNAVWRYRPEADVRGPTPVNSSGIDLRH